MVNMEQKEAGESPTTQRDVALTPMSSLQSPVPESSENTQEQESGDDVSLIPPESHQPDESSPTIPNFPPPTYTEPPPPYSLNAPCYIAAPLPQQQHQQQRHQQVVFTRVTKVAGRGRTAPSDTLQGVTPKGKKFCGQIFKE